jgi:EmrB/QacA subfamily drug resistance transporter
MLSALLIGTLIGTMGNSIVSVALPSLKDYYSISLSQTVLSITLYTLTFSVLIPVFGSLSRDIGFLTLFVSGMVLVTISSLLCIFAPNFTIFLISRVCIGVGVATVLPTIMGVISFYFPVEIQGKATGYWALINSLGHAIGPSIGGYLLNHFSWQSIFWINIPLAVISILIAIRVFPKDHREPNRWFDWCGAALMTAGVFFAMMGISKLSEFQSEKYIIFILLFIALILLALLLVRESRIDNPFVNLNLFKKKSYISSIAPISLQAFTQFGLLVSLPVFLININGVEKQLAGLIIMAMTVMMAIVSPIAGRITDKWSSKWVCFIGTLLTLFGALVMFIFKSETLATKGWITLIISLVIFGTAFGTIQSGSTVAALRAVSKEMVGAATGFFHMIRFLSASLGSTIFGIILEVNPQNGSAGFYYTFILTIVLSCITLPITLWINSNRVTQLDSNVVIET